MREGEMEIVCVTEPRRSDHPPGAGLLPEPPEQKRYHVSDCTCTTDHSLLSPVSSSLHLLATNSPIQIGLSSSTDRLDRYR